MKILALGLIAIAIFIVTRRKEPEHSGAEKYLQRQRAIRALKIELGIPFDYRDFAARRANGFD